MLENHAALKIQGLFASYRLNKQIAAQQAISTSATTKLLQAFDLRFQCMRAVAAAKFPINKPIEDPAQVERVLISISEFAREKGIINLEAVQQIFRHNIFLAEKIQSSYYDLIWRKSYYGAPDTQQLINNAYAQLRDLAHTVNLPVSCCPESADFTSADVLGLARDVIQHASRTIVEILADSTSREVQVISQEEFTGGIEKMLGNYMTPSALLCSQEHRQLLAHSVAKCSM